VWEAKENPLDLAAASTSLWDLLENGSKQIIIESKLQHCIESDMSWIDT